MQRLLVLRRVAVVAVVVAMVAGLAMADADMQGTWQRTTTKVADTGDTWRHEAWQTVAGDRTVLIVTYYNETTGLIVSKFWTGVTGTMEVELEEFERVPEALPSSPVGRWLFDDPFGYRYVLTIGADRSFDLTVFLLGDRYRRMTASVVAVDLDNYVAHLSNIQEAKWDDGSWSEAEPWHGPWDDGVGSIAFVPYHRGIALSPPWDERNPEMPHGFYGMFFEPAG